MATEQTRYRCQLDAKTVQKAEQELLEDPQNRQGAIDTFREWIRQQSHFKCPTDDVFLLGFLRAKHFSQLEAREALERFLIIRDKLSIWMKNLDPGSDEICDVIDHGIVLLLPGRDDQNRKVTIYRAGIMDAGNKGQTTACMRLFAAIFYLNYLCDEMTQVHGTTYTYDSLGHTMTNFLKLPTETRQGLGAMVSKAYPGRVKAIHICNAGGLLEFLLSVISKVVTEKLNKRVHIHSDLESWYKDVPMRMLPGEYLPDDYTGPCAGSVNDIKGSMKKTFRDPELRERIKYLSSDDFYIKIKEKDLDAPMESFRKLNVD